MARSRRVKGTASALTEGARRATGVSADGAAVGLGALAPGQRWSASRKRDVVLRLLRGESLDAVSREVGVEFYRLEAWKTRALAGLELGLRNRVRYRCIWRSAGRVSDRRCSVSGKRRIAKRHIPYGSTQSGRSHP